MLSTFQLEFTMNSKEQTHFDKLYTLHLRTLKLRGMSENTISSYARAIRRVSNYFDCSPDHLTTEQLEDYFSKLVDSHSWSTVIVTETVFNFSGSMFSKQIGSGLT